jgi:DNA-binding CsgD family transcriptional regulator
VAVRFRNISEREKEVLYWMAEGKTAEEIGIILGISKRTVEWHAHQAKTRARAANIVQTVAMAVKYGVIGTFGITGVTYAVISCSRKSSVLHLLIDLIDHTHTLIA